jgi:hypothetical protein
VAPTAAFAAADATNKLDRYGRPMPSPSGQANAKEVREREKIKKKKLFADAFRAVPEGRSRNANVVRLAVTTSPLTLRAAQHFESVGVLPGQSRRGKR